MLAAADVLVSEFGSKALSIRSGTVSVAIALRDELLDQERKFIRCAFIGEAPKQHSLYGDIYEGDTVKRRVKAIYTEHARHQGARSLRRLHDDQGAIEAYLLGSTPLPCLLDEFGIDGTDGPMITRTKIDVKDVNSHAKTDS
ncbi:hypothetical protein [Methylobacterium sp. UNC300MFChir4.1]|uniref:hypothetical protein n=1 Tax=Methylobacterium sp. UNC300MFChir4.1 TaxID=1502747 RepID=UPI0011141F5F|nr:hypothetical protein [Methylobacterium sp. UNC300MFChir4.1]